MQKGFIYLIWVIVISGFISLICCIFLFGMSSTRKHGCWLEGVRKYTICEGLNLETDKPLKINLTTWKCWGTETCDVPNGTVIKELKLDLPTGSFGRSTLSLLPELEVLTVDIRYFDKIEDGTFCLSPKLHTLFVWATRRKTELSKLSLRNCGNIKSLTLENVDIDSFAWRGLTNLEHIILRSMSIAYLNKKYFETLSNLKTLEISFSSITTVEPGVLCLSPKLEYLDLDHISLSSASAGLFKNCNGVRNILSVYNEGIIINSDTLGDLTGVTSLTLDSVSITHLKKSDLPNAKNLETLAIDRSSIKEIDSDVFDELNNLQILSLNNNNLARFNISSGLNNLRRLSLSNNELVSFDVSSDLNNLTDLSLDGNRLTRFNPEIMAHLPKLRELDLSSNRLKSIVGIKHPKLAFFKFFCNEFGDDFNVTSLILNIPKLSDIKVSHGTFRKYYSNNKPERFILSTRRDGELHCR